MDHGVATFPQDGDQADQLIRVADERLYRLKHANHGKTRPAFSHRVMGLKHWCEKLAQPSSDRVGQRASAKDACIIDEKIDLLALKLLSQSLNL